MAGTDSAQKSMVPTKASRKAKVADSWDDESSSDSDGDDNTVQAGQATAKLPHPSSSSLSHTDSAPRTSHDETERPRPGELADYENPYLDSLSSSSSGAASATSARGQQQQQQQQYAPTKRPEKTTAAAQRMIASAIGVRIKRTDEQRAFERAQVENAKRKRELERRQKEDEEKAKIAVWED